MRKKDFVLCIGCQKGATSWLYDQVSKSDAADLGFEKEYHVFDSLYVPNFRYFHNLKIQRLERQLHKGVKLASRHSELLTQINFVLNVETYYDYFESLWMKDEKITTVGDFTPSYAALPKKAFEEIRLNLLKRGFRVKIVFIMRDPVERCWSMVRMRRRNLLKKDPSLVLPDESTALRQTYRNRPCQLFTRYERTVKILEEVFEKEEVFYGVYENLFEDSTLNELEGFLEVEGFCPDRKSKVNVSRKNKLTLPSDIEEEIISYYQDTYQYCAIRFGTEKYWKTLSAA